MVQRIIGLACNPLDILQEILYNESIDTRECAGGKHGPPGRVFVPRWLFCVVGGSVGRRFYSDETRAAVMAALIAGQSISEVAAEYRIPEGTVKGWSASKIQPDATSSTERAEMGELILAYLRRVLITLEKQQVLFADEVWLRKQSASELALLHGVSTDKAFRLLESLNSGDDEELS